MFVVKHIHSIFSAYSTSIKTALLPTSALSGLPYLRWCNVAQNGRDETHIEGHNLARSVLGRFLGISSNSARHEALVREP
jgi:hypothetical protein